MADPQDMARPDCIQETDSAERWNLDAHNPEAITAFSLWPLQPDAQYPPPSKKDQESHSRLRGIFRSICSLRERMGR